MQVDSAAVRTFQNDEANNGELCVVKDQPIFSFLNFSEVSSAKHQRDLILCFLQIHLDVL